MARKPYKQVMVGRKNCTAHVLIAEKALGKKLPPKAIVHHADGDTLNNANSNLVICPDDAYHQLLHKRMRAYEATGDTGKRKCKHCKGWDSPEKMFVNSRESYHRECNAAYIRQRSS